MRLRQRDLKNYVVKRRKNLSDSDGTTYEGWGDSTSIQANIQPAGGRMMSEMYGERLAYMMVAYVESVNDIQESDGFCIYTNIDKDPDYKVVAIRRWNTHHVIDLEKVRT